MTVPSRLAWLAGLSLALLLLTGALWWAAAPAWAGAVAATLGLGLNLLGTLALRHRVAGELEGAAMQRAELQAALAQQTALAATQEQALAAARAARAEDEAARARQAAAQAAGLQRAATAVAALAPTVQQIAQRAVQADRLTQEATAVAVRGGQVVGQVVDTVKDIHEASAKVADIVGVIDGIAFQTNLLALNAAVEAARAGEQGRGFAVVATEVRSLAQRSAEAAKEIKQLIGASAERVAQGSTRVDQAGTAMTDIVQAVKRVHDVVGAIGADGVEQSAGMLQLGQAIAELESGMLGAASPPHGAAALAVRRGGGLQADCGEARRAAHPA